ncbi:hypothetical protein ATANTOWER_023500 [Ataeniobius toweri]|uniref:Uncharacterized protein n=1 Tax=Ataeniobius toweri TaxID=208326 RepID=A0ABU7AGP5_9TELE|nr:hypothetical protein [Ataeniobius toweri]
MVSHLSLGLDLAGSREEHPSHQALSDESRPHAWLQEGITQFQFLCVVSPVNLPSPLQRPPFTTVLFITLWISPTLWKKHPFTGLPTVNNPIDHSPSPWQTITHHLSSWFSTSLFPPGPDTLLHIIHCIK